MILKDKFILLLMLCLSGLLYHSYTFIASEMNSIATVKPVIVHQASSPEITELQKRVRSYKVSDKK